MSTPIDVAPSTTPSPPTANRGLLGAAVAIGVANALWSLFQWAELLLARQGGTPFCSLNATFDCAQVWDSPFAVAVHDVTRIPIAGWGLAWALAAVIVPLFVLIDERRLASGGAAALRFTGLAGVASVAGLGAASAAAGALCLGCIGTYALVIGWTLCAWRASSPHGFAAPVRGAMGAGAVVVVSLLGLLYPGQQTPHAQQKLALPSPATPSAASSTSNAAPAPAAPATPGPFGGPSTGDPVRDDLLTRFMATLDDQTKQTMSDLLAAYRDGKPGVLAEPRAVVLGDAKAPLRITDWTDPLCPHCAMLHEVLAEIARTVPPGLFVVEARHFPLDGACNPGVQRKSPDGTRCVGALASICMEGDPRAFEASGALFAARAQTPEAVYEALKPFRDPAKLKQCVESDAAKKKLLDDVNAAMQFNIEGTPLVLLNGREVRAVPPLLYALILTGGSWQNAAFASLPAPRPLPADGADHVGHAH